MHSLPNLQRAVTCAAPLGSSGTDGFVSHSPCNHPYPLQFPVIIFPMSFMSTDHLNMKSHGIVDVVVCQYMRMDGIQTEDCRMDDGRRTDGIRTEDGPEYRLRTGWRRTEDCRTEDVR